MVRSIQITKIKESSAFIAFVTERFIEQKEKKYRECKLAEELNKPMYAIVENRVVKEMVILTDGSSSLEVREIPVSWLPFENLPWRKIYYCEDGRPLESIVKDIEEDLAWYKSIQR